MNTLTDGDSDSIRSLAAAGSLLGIKASRIHPLPRSLRTDLLLLHIAGRAHLDTEVHLP